MVKLTLKLSSKADMYKFNSATDVTILCYRVVMTRGVSVINCNICVKDK